MGRRLNVVGATIAATPMVAAGVAGARYTARAADAHRRHEDIEPGVPAPAPSVGLAAAVAADTLMGFPVGLLSSIGSPAAYERASAEVDAAARHYEAAGWLDDPGARHPAPTAVPAVRISAAAGRHGRRELLRFDSGWRPEPGEPAGDRWRSYVDNERVRVTVLRHPGPPRPWLVMVHGQGMGRAGDVTMLRARRIHHRHGLNVALPVLPLHGRRRSAMSGDQQFVSNVFLLNNVLGLTQAVWDLRRLLLWLREDQGAPSVGVLGVSLGSYACSLLATVEADLACVVAIVPTSDLASSLRRSKPVVASRRRLHRALHDERSTKVHHVVSPLARPCLVAWDRRFIVAGQADRIAPPAGAAELWRHWDQPSIDWRPRGHLTLFRSASYDDHLDDILVSTGLTGGDACAS